MRKPHKHQTLNGKLIACNNPDCRMPFKVGTALSGTANPRGKQTRPVRSWSDWHAKGNDFDIQCD